MHNDKLTEQIEELILEATEPKDKAFLLILNKIANNLDENTTLTRTLTEDLKKHASAFEKHEQKELTAVSHVKGFFYAIVLMQGLAVWFINGHLLSFSNMEVEVATIKTDIATHREHHRQEELYKGVVYK